MSIHAKLLTSHTKLARSFGPRGAVACVVAAVLALTSAGCTSHHGVSGGDIDPPASGDIIAESERTVTATSGISFTLRGATVTIPSASLEYDSIFHFALCRDTALPAEVPLPAGERAFLVIYAMVDVRVSGSWPLTVALISDFGDPAPDDPDFVVRRLNADTQTYDLVESAEVTATSVSWGLLPGYWVITVPDDTSLSLGLVGSISDAEIVFASPALDTADNAFSIRDSGTDLVRLTNALAPDYTDRPYVSRAGTRFAVVRSYADAAVAPDRIFASTPQTPLGHLTQIAQAPSGVRIGDLSFEPSGVSLLAAGRVEGADANVPGVYRVYLTGGYPAELAWQTPDAADPVSVACSSDASLAAVTTRRHYPSATLEGDYDIEIVPTDPTSEAAPVRLTANLHGDSGPTASVSSLCFSADGAVVYFGAEASGEHRVFAAATDGSGVTEITALYGCRWPGLSEDGAALVAERGGSLVSYALGSESATLLGPPANGLGFSLVSPRCTKISWLGR